MALRTLLKAMRNAGGRLARRAVPTALLLLAAACEPLPAAPPANDDGPRPHSVWVVSNGWHTGIIVSRDDLAPGRVPEAADFPRAAFFEFGWGDREYYPSRQPTFGMALAAAISPSPAVMHLAGLQSLPRPVPERLEVLTLRLTAAGLDRLTASIDESFERPADGRAQSVAPGLYAHSLFYPAHGRFHLFNTCNSWTARQLAVGGVGISPSGVLTADDLMRRLRAAEGVE